MLFSVLPMYNDLVLKVSKPYYIYVGPWSTAYAYEYRCRYAASMVSLYKLLLNLF